MRKLGRASIAVAISLTAIVGLLMGGSAQTAPTFSYYKVASGGFEAGLDISPTGRFFVNEPNGLGAQSNLWYSDALTSTNGSFTKVVFPIPFNRLPGGGDSDVIVGHSGRVYFLDLWGGSNSLIRSDNNGTSWTAATPFTTVPLTDRQWIAVGPEVNGKDVVYIAYQNLNPPNQVWVSRSNDSGLTWTQHVPVPGLINQGFTGQLVADDNGFVAVDHVDGEELHVYHSTDGGLTWTDTRVSTLSTAAWGRSIPSLAMDPTNGSLHATWIKPNSYRVVYARSPGPGQPWSTPVELTGNGSNVYSWVAANAGKAAVTWYGTDLTTSTQPDNVSSSTYWYQRYAQTTDGGVTFSPTVNASLGRVKQGIICTAGLGCNGGRELGDFQQVQVASDGTAYTVYGSLAGVCPCGIVVAKQISS